MKGLLAAFYKDMKLMMNATGIATLLLSVALLPAFLFGAHSLRTNEIMRPFPIAVRDLDRTFMSRSLIAQMREIELFSEIRVIGEEETDAEALQAGCAAVITVPLDFFYAMYTGRECPVDVALNENQVLAASMVRAVFTSIMDIIAADQSAWRAAYRYAYGEPDEGRLAQMYEDASKDLFIDALGRQNVFADEIRLSDTAGVMRRRLAAILLPMLSMLFAVSAFVTLAQERRMGVIARVRASGTPPFAFPLSKLFTSLLWVVPMDIVVFFLSGTNRPLLFALLSLAVWAASCCVMVCAVRVAADESSARRICNLYLLLSLFFSGTLFPADNPLQAALISRYVYPVLHGMYAEEGTRAILMRLLPFVRIGLAAVAVCVVASVAGKYLKPRMRLSLKSGAARTGEGEETRRIPLPVRLIRMTAMKTGIFAGGFPVLLIVCLCMSLSGHAVANAASGSGGGVPLCVSDEDDSAESRALCRMLEEKGEGILRIVYCTRAEAAEMLLGGEAEGMLVIDAGYGETIRTSGSVSLTYKSNAAAFSEQAVREVIAGQVARQRAMTKAVREGCALRGETVSEEARTQVLALMEEEEAKLPPMYRLSGLGGVRARDPFMPARISFLALALMLVLMTFAAYSGRPDAARIERRLAVSFAGRALTYGADFAAVTVTGVLAAASFYLTAGMPQRGEALAAFLLVLAGAAFSLCLTRLVSGTGRVDALAPLMTLFICLAGGCFLDLSVLSERLSGLMMLSPAGAALHLTRGNVVALPVIGVQILFFFLAGIRRRDAHGGR